MTKPLTEMTIDELLEEEDDAYLNEREVTQSNGDWRKHADYCARVTEEIERRGRPRKQITYETQL